MRLIGGRGYRDIALFYVSGSIHNSIRVPLAPCSSILSGYGRFISVSVRLFAANKGRVGSACMLMMLFWAGCLVSPKLQAQETKRKGIRIGLGQQDEARSRSTEKANSVFVFPNVNKVSFYNEPDKLKRIQEYNRKKNYRI